VTDNNVDDLGLITGSDFSCNHEVQPLYSVDTGKFWE